MVCDEKKTMLKTKQIRMFEFYAFPFCELTFMAIPLHMIILTYLYSNGIYVGVKLGCAFPPNLREST